MSNLGENMGFFGRSRDYNMKREVYQEILKQDKKGRSSFGIEMILDVYASGEKNRIHRFIQEIVDECTSIALNTNPHDEIIVVDSTGAHNCYEDFDDSE